MCDNIVWYAPEILLIAVVMLMIITAAITHSRREQKGERYFDKVEEL